MKARDVPDDARLEYTQHTVAFPQLRLDGAETDQVNVGLNSSDGGSYGEMKWTFYTFPGESWRRDGGVRRRAERPVR